MCGFCKKNKQNTWQTANKFLTILTVANKILKKGEKMAPTLERERVVTRDVLAELLADRAEITLSAARDEVRWFFDTISSSLAEGHEVRIHGFGTYRTMQRAARMGRNPRTGEPVQVPARRVVRFTPSTTLTTSLRSTRGGRTSR